MIYDPYKPFNPIYMGAAKALFGAGRGSYSAAGKYINSMLKSSGGPNVTTTQVRKRVKSKRKSFAARVRALEAYKHNTINDSVNAAAGITANTIYTNSITTKVTQGDTNADRTGDAIQLVALKIKGVINSATTAGAYGYRILVGWSTKQFNVSGSAAGLGLTDIFLPSTGANWTPSAIVNPKAFTVLHDSMVDINSQITATADLAQVDIKVPLSGKFEYVSSGSVYGKTRNLYLIVIPAVIGGTSGTTQCGSYAFNTDLIFQDQ